MRADQSTTVPSAAALGHEPAHSRRCARLIVIEAENFLRDCLMQGLSAQWPGGAEACAEVADLAALEFDRAATVVVLSIISLNEAQADAEFVRLMAFDPALRTMILSRADNPDEALAALSHGANGYIAMSAPFDVFVEAARFVGAGGAYVPAQYLLAARQAPPALPAQAALQNITSREFAVIRAIRQGKPNKTIAYELNMCESTVKVHVRHIMKKLRARNRTDVAIKGGELLAADMARATLPATSLFARAAPAPERAPAPKDVSAAP